METQASNVYDLEDIIAYCKCPLRQKYRSWGVEEKVVDAREAVRISSSQAIRTYLREGRAGTSGPRLALDRAVAAYKKSLGDFDKQGLFAGDMKFPVHFNFGLVLIRRFHELIDPLHDRPINGPVNCSYPVGEDVVVGDIEGVIAFNQTMRSELRFGVVSVSQRPTNRSTWERVREGFCYGAIRKLTSGIRTFPLVMINVDPWARKIDIYSISADHKADFEALASAAIQGIKHDIHVPQPIKANCRICPYDVACKLKYSKPGDKRWHKKEFLRDMRE